VIRLSAVPSHFSTAVFSTCNVKFWHFFVATLLSLPKQVFLVYLGVLLVQENKSDVIQNVMFAFVFVISMVLGVYIWFKMKKIKTVLLEEQNLRREKKLKDEMAELDKEAAERVSPMEDPGRPAPSWNQQMPSLERSQSPWATHRDEGPNQSNWPLMVQQPPSSRNGTPFDR
jgi:hypothetical protein